MDNPLKDEKGRVLVPMDKDMRLCMSLSGRPGNFGVRFHNFLYHHYKQPYFYKSFTTNDIEGAIRAIRALQIRGCAISMPFKERVIPLIDEVDSSAERINAVNTIVNENGHLKAYNTDYIAVCELLKKNNVSTSASVLLYGSGGMAKAIAYALSELGFTNTL